MKTSKTLKVFILATTFVACIQSANAKRTGTVPSVPNEPDFPRLTPESSLQLRVYNTAAYNIVASLKRQLDEMGVESHVCSPNPENAAMAADDLITAFKNDSVIPQLAKRIINYSWKVYCLGKPEGLGQLLKTTCLENQKTSNYSSLSTSQLDALNVQVEKTLECMFQE